MDVSWIQVFVLTVSECVAPAGKTICQQQEFELTFLTEADCAVAREQFIALKEASESVIVNADATRCVATARQRESFPSLAAVNAASAGRDDYRPPSRSQAEADSLELAHQQRLERIPECQDGREAYPCRKGKIIIEAPAPNDVEIWRVESD
ncbi:MAG: hypothetical protein AAFX56_09060 [Pseudomonadota bacterium]